MATTAHSYATTTGQALYVGHDGVPNGVDNCITVHFGSGEHKRFARRHPTVS